MVLFAWTLFRDFRKAGSGVMVEVVDKNFGVNMIYLDKSYEEECMKAGSDRPGSTQAACGPWCWFIGLGSFQPVMPSHRKFPASVGVISTNYWYILIIMRYAACNVVYPFVCRSPLISP
ncbi:hypothetical protein Nepgr_009104 [Nepenthes gracilis]|uniref:Uncharacterized protein n=1 Tax=Nepenthes gracilis TaxID=150966 RepID=A0AAD3SAB0_NEPGR|nr:hypothetical protein Nepgr_009104 [Nepenthes gracilis]